MTRILPGKPRYPLRTGAAAAHGTMTVDSPNNLSARARPDVCVLDPDESLAGHVRDVLAPLGVAVHLYRTGAAFLEEAVGDPLCVVSEMRLPDMSGVELIEALRERGGRTPVILLATESDISTAVAGMRAGALDFIEKPHIDRLLAWHVRRLLEHHDSSGLDGAD